MYFVYILKCKNASFYVGCTQNIKDRLSRHNKGYVPVTKPLLPIKLICCITFVNKYKAFEFEKYLKSGSGRAFTNKHLV